MRKLALSLFVSFSTLAIFGAIGYGVFLVGYHQGKSSPREFLRGYTLLTPEPMRSLPPENDQSDLNFDRFQRMPDIAYSTHPRNVLDLYVPVGIAGPSPTVVFIHGSGTFASSRGAKPSSWAVPLLRRGFTVAQIEYRPFKSASGSPGPDAFPFPAQVDDCKSAIRFLRTHAARYRIDPGRIGVMGESFGGYLASLAGTTGDLNSLGSTSTGPKQGSSVQAVCAVSGMTDMRIYVKQADLHRVSLGYDWPELDTTGQFYISKMSNAQLDRSSPVSHVDPHDPPFLLLHGYDDASVPPSQSDLLYVRLRNAGVDAKCYLIPGASHGGPTLNNKVTRDVVAEFFNDHLVANRNLPSP